MDVTEPGAFAAGAFGERTTAGDFAIEDADDGIRDVALGPPLQTASGERNGDIGDADNGVVRAGSAVAQGHAFGD